MSEKPSTVPTLKHRPLLRLGAGRRRPLRFLALRRDSGRSGEFRGRLLGIALGGAMLVSVGLLLDGTRDRNLVVIGYSAAPFYWAWRGCSGPWLRTPS